MKRSVLCEIALVILGSRQVLSSAWMFSIVHSTLDFFRRLLRRPFGNFVTFFISKPVPLLCEFLCEFCPSNLVESKR